MENFEMEETPEIHKPSRVSVKEVTTGWRPYLFQTMIFTLTYVSYAGLHFTREGWSILKTDVEDNQSPGLGWEGTNNTGLIDFSFLIFYSLGLFISGVLGDNYPIRIIVPIGYATVALMVFMVSLGGSMKIDNVYYYVVFFAINGLCESIGLPCYISVIGNWFSRESRGLAFGAWCSCQYIGNIGGNLLVNLLRGTFGMSWMMSFRVISIFVAILAVLNFLLLIDDPKMVNIVIDVSEAEELDKRKLILKESGESKLNQSKPIKFTKPSKDSNNKSLEMVWSKYNKEATNELLSPEEKKHINSDNKIEQTNVEEGEEAHAIGFWKAWLVPGVIQFAVCIAFVKWATYGVLFWLPAYADKELNYDHASVGIIAIANDVGTIFGCITLGKISDMMYKKRSPIAFVSLLAGGILFLLIAFLSDSSKYVLYTLIFFVGFLVGGVFNIVTATAAADLAKGDQIKGNDKALSTITGIFDGSGSFGAAFGSLIIGEIRKRSWNGVFIFLAIAVFISSLPIVKVMLKEIREIKNIRQRDSINNQDNDKLVDYYKFNDIE